jgi:hypothetical protein
LIDVRKKDQSHLGFALANNYTTVLLKRATLLKKRYVIQSLIDKIMILFVDPYFQSKVYLRSVDFKLSNYNLILQTQNYLYLKISHYIYTKEITSKTLTLSEFLQKNGIWGTAIVESYIVIRKDQLYYITAFFYNEDKALKAVC